MAVAAQKGPGIVIAHPGEDVELLCNLTATVGIAWRVNGTPYTLSELFNGQPTGHNTSGTNIIVENIMMNDVRNGTTYTCIQSQTPPTPDIESDPTFLYVAGEYNILHYIINKFFFAGKVIPHYRVQNTSLKKDIFRTETLCIFTFVQEKCLDKT